MIDQLRASISETAHLEQRRDALLPRFLSGELDVTAHDSAAGLLEGIAGALTWNSRTTCHHCRQRALTLRPKRSAGRFIIA